MTQHPIHAALNKPLLWFGVDRTVALVAVFGGMVVYAIGQRLVGPPKSLGAAVLLSGALLVVARMTAVRDAKFFHLLAVGMKLKRSYDAGLRR